MSKKRRSFTSRQRLEIVLEGLQEGASVAEVCRRHGISSTLYYRWRDQLFTNAERLFERKGRRPLEMEALESENQKLKDVIAEITAENLDLKKTPGTSRTTRPFRRSSGR
jgi:transposase